MSKFQQTPWLLIFIGLGFLSLTVWSIYRASQETSPVADVDYYNHGLRYNQTLLEMKAAEVVGWTTKISLVRAEISLFVFDHEEQPVSRARAEMMLQNAETMRSKRLIFTEKNPGHYTVTLPKDMAGEYTADIVIDRDGKRIHKRLLIALN